MTMAALIRLAYSLRGSGYYVHGGEHGGTQTDMIECSIFDSESSRKRKPVGLVWDFEISKPTPSDTLLQQGHTDFSRPRLLIPLK